MPARQAPQPAPPEPPRVAAERRLTSVLFADLVSYTSLAERRDSEDVRDLLSAYFDACRTVVRRYGGTIEKFIGDAVMAVWGVPAAHEDDAERAVRAGLELVAAVAELGESLGVPGLTLRAGVVTGEVAATLGATDQGMVAGDPVNTAARVQAAAGPGEVWVDAATRSLTEAAIDYVDAGEHALKGKADRVRLFHADAVVAARGGRQRVDGLEAPLTGRVHELRLLKELFHATEESGRPRLVVLDGAAGTGKTRLAWELQKYLDGIDTEVRWHHGRCLAYGEGVALWALAEAVRVRLGLLNDAAGPDLTAGLDAALAACITDPDEYDWLRPRLLTLLGGPGVDVGREDLFAAWTRFFERVGDGRPVGIVIEDGQYADVGLLDFVEFLIANARIPVFVLLLARPELIAGRPDLGGRRTTVVRVDPLSGPAMAELVGKLVDGLPVSARAALAERSEGIPLYAVEMVRALIDRDLVLPRDGRYVVDEAAQLDLTSVSAPASLHALVAARLDALTPDERRVVADASVLGLSFRAEDVRALDDAVAELDDVLLSLARKEILAPDNDPFSAERGRYRFVQAVVRQIAYGTLSKRDRKAKHLRAADHLAARTDRADELAAVVAQHLSDAAAMSGPADVDKPEIERRTAALLAKAGARACLLCSFGDGLRLLEAALDRLDDDPARADLQEGAAQAALALGRWDTAYDLASAALKTRDAEETPLAAAWPASLKAAAMMNLGRHHAAREVLEERYAALVDVPGADRARLHLALELGRALSQLGEHAAGRAADEEALRLAEQLGDVGRTAEAMNALAIDQMSHGSLRVGSAMLRDLIELCQEHELWACLTRAHNSLAVFRRTFTAAEGLEHSEAALKVAVEHGEHGWSELVTANLCVGLWIAGEWDRLAELMAEYRDYRDDHGPMSGSMVQTVDLWRADAGLERVTEGYPAFEADSLCSLAWGEHARVVLATSSGDLRTAATHARSCVSLSFEDKRLQDDFAIHWERSVFAAFAASDTTLAAELIDVVGNAPPGEVTPLLHGHLHVFRALLAAAGGDPADVEAGFRRGIAALDAYGAPPLRARAEEELGRWLLAQGRAADAELALDAARTTYTQLGARTWVARVASANRQPPEQASGAVRLQDVRPD